MPYEWRRKVLLWKIETTEGTDATPTGAADAMLVANPTHRIGARPVQRNLVQAYLGAQPQVQSQQTCQLEFDVEIAGAGAAGTAAPFGALLRCCAMAETINAGTDAQYDPVSDRATMESGTGYYNMDGVNHALVGGRGNCSLKIAAQDVPHFHFAMTGLYVAPSAVALPSADFSAFQDPAIVDDANTPTFTLHGQACVLQELDIDFANAVSPNFRVGANRVSIGDRPMSGTALIEMPAIGTKDFYAAWNANTRDALQVVHGTVAGNIVQLDAPKVQIVSIAEEDGGGDTMLRLGLSLIPDTGDDEIKITVK